MKQIELFAIASPCIGVCQSNQRGFCKGCLRSRDERFNWLYFSNEEKRQVLVNCSKRRKRILMAQKRQQDQQQNSQQQMIEIQSNLPLNI